MGVNRTSRDLGGGKPPAVPVDVDEGALRTLEPDPGTPEGPCSPSSPTAPRKIFRSGVDELATLVTGASREDPLARAERTVANTDVRSLRSARSVTVWKRHFLWTATLVEILAVTAWRSPRVVSAI
jgi:hypothetical protein